MSKHKKKAKGYSLKKPLKRRRVVSLTPEQRRRILEAPKPYTSFMSLLRRFVPDLPTLVETTDSATAPEATMDLQTPLISWSGVVPAGQALWQAMGLAQQPVFPISDQERLRGTISLTSPPASGPRLDFWARATGEQTGEQTWSQALTPDPLGQVLTYPFNVRVTLPFVALALTAGPADMTAHVVLNAVRPAPPSLAAELAKDFAEDARRARGYLETIGRIARNPESAARTLEKITQLTEEALSAHQRFLTNYGISSTYSAALPGMSVAEYQQLRAQFAAIRANGRVDVSRTEAPFYGIGPPLNGPDGIRTPRFATRPGDPCGACHAGCPTTPCVCTCHVGNLNPFEIEALADEDD